MTESVASRPIDTTGASPVAPVAKTGKNDNVPMDIINKIMGFADNAKTVMDILGATARMTIEQIKNNNSAMEALQNLRIPETRWPAPSESTPGSDQYNQYNQACYDATIAIEEQGVSLAGFQPLSYRSYDSAAGVDNVQYAYSPIALTPQYLAEHPTIVQKSYIANPSPDMLVQIMSMVADPPLEEISQTLVCGGVKISDDAFDAAKYVWGDRNQIAYSTLPVKVVDDPAALARTREMDHMLVQKAGTDDYYRLEGQVAYLVKSPLPLDQAVLVDPNARDFSMYDPGTLIKQQTGMDKQGMPVYAYYQVVSDNTFGTGLRTSSAVEVTPLLKFVLRPSDVQKSDWRDQLGKLNTGLGTVSNTEQVMLQEKNSHYNNFLILASNLISEIFRALNAVRL